jgi:predicted nucleic acid-binding protein
VILVDTSVWIDHLRKGESRLRVLLESGHVLSHPFVIGELAMGSFKQRGVLLQELRNLPQATVAYDDEVLGFITTKALFGLGIGYIDAHLLAAAKLTPGTFFWTRDRRLREVATKLNLAAAEQ